MTDPEPTPVATTETTPATTAVPPPVELSRKRGRGLGTTSFVFAFLAILGNAVFAALLIATIATATNDVDAALGLLAVAFVVVILVFWGGLLFGAVSILFGIAGLIRGSGRVLAVIGILLSLGVIAVNLLFGWGLLTGGASLLDQFTDGLDEL